MTLTNDQELRLPARYQTLLSTNYIPTDSECGDIRDFLVGPEQQLAGVNADMDRLQTLIKGLESRRDILQKFISAHRALISPMRRMPPEILQHIFGEVLPERRNCAISKKEGPLLLGLVSKSWRAVTLATPRLWASVHIVVPPLSHVEALARWLQIVWLPRSGIRPLDISLTHSGPWLTLEAQSLERMYDVLIGVAHRWRDVELTLRSLDNIRYLSKHLQPTALPHLQKFKLRSGVQQRDVAGVADPSELPLAFLGTSPIRTLLLPDMPQLYVVNSIPSSTFSRLVSLTVEGSQLSNGISCEVLWQTLRQCTSLESCDIICGALQNTPSTPEPAPFSLPSLQEFSITYSRLPHGGGAPRHFFTPLQLPNLRVFSCHTQAPWLTLGGVRLVDLLPDAASLLGVEQLTIGINLLESEMLLSALERFPALHKLSLRYEPKGPIIVDPYSPTIHQLGPSEPKGDDMFLAKLGRRMASESTEPNPAILPHLQLISLHELTAATDDTIAAFIRTCAGHGVRRVKCFVHRRRERKILAGLQDVLSSSGMVLDLRYSGLPEGMAAYSPFIGLRTAMALAS
ncbi:hypothetical protein C8F01DRAFT_1192541 [Mycena amicta]|nr:hypothetical protein C8F01DRAFT_1192541 [Mycena amicta]